MRGDYVVVNNAFIGIARTGLGLASVMSGVTGFWNMSSGALAIRSHIDPIQFIDAVPISPMSICTYRTPREITVRIQRSLRKRKALNLLNALNIPMNTLNAVNTLNVGDRGLVSLPGRLWAVHGPTKGKKPADGSWNIGMACHLSDSQLPSTEEGRPVFQEL